MPAGTIDLRALLDADRVLRVQGKVDRDQLLAKLAEVTTFGLAPPLRTAFAALVREREEVAPTGIGRGYALPHARLPGLDRCRIGLAIAPDGIDFRAGDGLPARVVAMLASRDADHIEHLRVMAAIAIRLKTAGLIELLCKARDAEVPALLAGSPGDG